MSELLFLDIETIPAGNPESIEVKAPSNYKDEKKIAAYIESHRNEEFRKRALKGITGEIVSIAWAIGDGEIESVTRGLEACSEDDLLRWFFNDLERQDPTHYRWIGHNSIDFDLRYLKQRCWINNIKPAVMIPADAKHGDFSFDVMREFAGWKGFVSQDALYEALGGPPIDNDIDGSMVYDLWLAGEYEKIAEYNRVDVQKLRYNYRRLT